MAFTYYPDETNKLNSHVIEQLQKPDVLYSVFGTQDLTAANLGASVWCPKGWEVKRVSLHFTSAVAKDYSISIIRGVGIVTDKNDRLWVKANSVPSQKIIVPQGFYTGTTLATALVTALGLGSFPAASEPFGVTYNATTGLFTITPAAGNAQIFVTNLTVPVLRRSTAASLIGFTADTTMTTPLVSNAAVKQLGTAMVYLSASASTTTDVLSTDSVAMTVDDQLLISASSAAGTAIYEVVYRILDA